MKLRVVSVQLRVHLIGYGRRERGRLHRSRTKETLYYPSPRDDELRLVTIGLIGTKFYAVVWTERGEATR